MKLRISFISGVSVILMMLQGCNFSKSVNTDLLTGLTTVGNGLSCDDVYMSMTDGHIQKNTFIYGEEFDVNFSNIEGFTKVEGAVFPGLSLVVTDEAGEIVMETDDLYAGYTEGMDFSPLLLAATLTVATPIQSNNNYLLSVKVWDKEGPGTFTAKLPFEVIVDDRISLEHNQTACTEVYLFSGNTGHVITSQEVAFDEDIYLIFEGLTGFKEDDGKIFVGMSLNATDNAGKILLALDDMFGSYGENDITANILKEQASANLVFTKGVITNPVYCEVVIYDKKGEARITAKTELSVH
jgi:hypothetical protein